MKNCSKPQRVIAIALVVSLLAGLIPTVALAARNGEIPDIIEYKAMSLVNLQGGEWLSRYEYAQEDNTFYSDVNLNVPSLLRIGFTIEKSQYVNLALYELKDGAVLDGGDGYPHAHLEYYFDPEAPDFGASVPEDFLGAKIGYISGVPVLDNIVDPDPNADTVEYNRISEEKWAEIIQHTYDTGMSEKKPMVDVYAYGFKGEKLPEPAAAATQMADAGPGEEDDSVYSYAPDTDTIAGMPVEVNVEGAETLSEEELTSLDRDTTADEVPEIDASEPPVGDEERPAEKETAGQNGDTVDNVGIEAHTTEIATKAEEPAQESLLPISDVLYDPSPISAIFSPFALQSDNGGNEWAIENYILWDGSVVTESGSEVQYDFHDGYYVIVLEPCRADAAVYNSFLGFMSTTEERPPFTMDAYAEPGEIIEWE